MLDAQWKRVTSVPSYMQDYHFNQDIRAFTLGDTDTPPFKLYATKWAEAGEGVRLAGPIGSRSWLAERDLDLISSKKPIGA